MSKRTSINFTMGSKMQRDQRQDKSIDYLNRLDNYRLSNEEFLDRNFGPGTWTHDPFTNDYYVFDSTYTGPGRGYLVLDQDLRQAPIAFLLN
jgi:hypothetical protein